jgi:hypothetical protein
MMSSSTTSCSIIPSQAVQFGLLVVDSNFCAIDSILAALGKQHGGLDPSGVLHGLVLVVACPEDHNSTLRAVEPACVYHDSMLREVSLMSLPRCLCSYTS